MPHPYIHNTPLAVPETVITYGASHGTDIDDGAKLLAVMALDVEMLAAAGVGAC